MHPDEHNPIAQQTVLDFLGAIEAKKPTPGGGAVAGVVGALGSALGHMVVAYSLGKKSLAPHQPLLESSSKELLRARQTMLQLAEEDAAAYSLASQLRKLPEGDAVRVRGLAGAIDLCIAAPMNMLALSCNVLRALRSLCGTSNAFLRSDLAIAAILAHACADASAWNVRINLTEISNDTQRVAALDAQVAAMLSEAARLRGDVEAACRG